MWTLVMLTGALVLRAWLAWDDHSVFWPDEIYQSLEQAHRAVFGYGLVPWEFRDGARSWLFPAAISALWKMASMLGVDSSLTLVLIARLSMVAASLLAIWFASRLALASAGELAAIAVLVIMATFPASVAFAYRAMSETASAPLVVIGAWFLTQRTPRSALYAGLAMAIACVLRYQSGLFVLTFLATLLLQRRLRDAAAFCASGATVASLSGLLDWVTWGSPFHSFITYFDFNLIYGGASTFGVEPFSFYWTSLWSSAGPLLLPLVACFCVGSVAEPVLGGAVLIYVLAHCVLPHKELRFLVPSFPLFATVSGIGFERMLRKLPAARVVGVASAVLTTLAFAHALTRLEYQDMGQYKGTERATNPVWKSEQEPSLLLAEAGRHLDVCGVLVLGARAAFTGGYTYLHRDVPLMYESQPCSIASANYVIEPIARQDTLPVTYELLSRRGDWGLFRRDGVCRPIEGYDNLLEGARDMGLTRQMPVQSSDGGIEFDLQRDSGAFARGWGHGELLDCDTGRWAVNSQALIRFDFTPAAQPYELNLRARAHEGALPQTFGIAVNGRPVHLGPMANQLKVYSADIPEGALHPGTNTIELAFGRLRPPTPEDERELAALFRSITIVPKLDDFSIDVALAESRPHLLRGFHPNEQADDVTFAWSDGHSSEIEGVLVSPRFPYMLEMLVESIPTDRAQGVRVFSNDTFVERIEIPARWATRRVVIPAKALVKGKNRIRLEYETVIQPAVANKGQRDQRQLAVRFRRIVLSPLRANHELDVGTFAARPFLLEGWSHDEQDDGRSLVWTNGARASAVLSLRNIERPVLHVRAQGYAPAMPSTVRVSLNGNPVGAFTATASWQDVALPLPSAEYAAEGEVITLDIERTVRPSRRNARSDDERQLGLRVDRLWIEPEAGSELHSSVRSLRAD